MERIPTQRSTVLSRQPKDLAPKILDLPTGLDATGMRREFGSLGDVQVPANRYWGAQTHRIITCEQDVVRDEGEANAHKLMAAGVPVRATRYLGAIHDLALLNPIMAERRRIRPVLVPSMSSGDCGE